MRQIGAIYSDDGKCEFVLWAPLADRLSVLLLTEPRRTIALTRDAEGYFTGCAEGIKPGDRYLYLINGQEQHPDPASYYQPEDVLGPSCVVDHGSFQWGDANWKGTALEKMILYELHIGTFTPQGTFSAAASRLDDLTDLGITAIELMPVAQFPGERNWGYDGVYPFAVQHSYGGPDGLKAFVDACHQKGIAVVLDVVYNHLGPEGNFLPRFMPCFTDKYKTPWGNAINFDDAYSFGVRDFFIQNALYWFEHFHIDALRLDAIHGIFDMGAKHFLRELSESVDAFSQKKQRKYYLIAESDLNDTRIIHPSHKGGYGMDAQWCDDFHHGLHTVLTKEQSGYYEDFGSLSHLIKALKEGFVYSWDFSTHRRRYHGSSSADIPGDRFVVCLQNHDQIGNRLNGERTSALLSFEALKLGAATVMFSPFIPLLFMGEEYGEEAPFLYFMSFYDETLIRNVREGRKKEFSSFNWQQDPPDPYAVDTFLRSKLTWHRRADGKHKTLLAFYKKLIELRKSRPALICPDKAGMDIEQIGATDVIAVKRRHGDDTILALMNFCDQPTQVRIENRPGKWHKLLDSSAPIWGGPGSPLPDRVDFAESRLDISPLTCVLYEAVDGCLI